MGWYPRISTGQLSFYRAIPKVELHRHLEGSLRLNTLLEIAREHGLTIPETHFSSLVQMQKDDPLTFANFLGKFQTLRIFYRSPEVITRITREAIVDAAEDGVKYLELRFTPMALSRLQGFSYGEVMDWVLEAAQEAERQTHVVTRLIVSVNRHEPVSVAEEVIRQAVDRKSRGIVGFDLAGNEVEFPARPFAGVFREARESGLHLTVHAGEWGGPENVREAIEVLGAERIGHGVRVMEDPSVVDLARERHVLFEVCMTSNFQTGVVPSLQQHPLPQMVEAGLNVSINTDDPGISRITLTDEYRVALEEMGMPVAALVNCILAAALGSFQPPEDRVALATQLQPTLNKVLRNL
ncbi:MAG TPA: adenosine deaminase [Anaerolinea thermolimosa]|uniref:adenosine deaminase n=1 Tax=Anaerolinea thermolimosa TaxID=229919 RepID=A0A3D1JHS0_9CHLR|nr:adenosine deaminase [Anaerolinea thermolimosa]GAP05638.1 adenosine deaminase [Anaerolinea thermolimosa]HCE17166.1 adenosine deaminase [Anaerolinea thermolimosa]